MTWDMVTYRSFKPVKYPITAEIHEAIIKVYQRDTGNGQVRALATRIGYPRWKISRYAVRIGLISKQKKEPDWSERELHIMELNAHRCPEIIQKKLKQAGFTRSVCGIVLKRKRERMPGNLEGMSARALSNCLGVDEHFVTRAIKGNRLKAEMRETHRTKAQGGEIYFIKEKAIKKYILNWLNEIDIRKVNKYWFCSIISSR